MRILSTPESTEVIYGAENAISKTVKALSEVKDCTDVCWDAAGPSIAVTTEHLWKTLNELARRGVRIRCITDIMRDNIAYCKMMTEIGIQVRHLSEIKSVFGINDRTEYIATVITEEKNAPVQYIVSNVKSFVEGQQSVFDNLWSKALPAEQKIEEIEGHVSVKYETKVLVNPDEIFSRIKYVIDTASKGLLCSTSGGMQMIYNNFFDLYKKLLINKEEVKEKVYDGLLL